MREAEEATRGLERSECLSSLWGSLQPQQGRGWGHLGFADTPQRLPVHRQAVKNLLT